MVGIGFYHNLLKQLTQINMERKPGDMISKMNVYKAKQEQKKQSKKGKINKYKLAAAV